MIYLHMLIEEDITMQKKRVVAVRRVRPYSFKGSAAVPPNCKNLCRELGSISHPTDNQKSIIISHLQYRGALFLGNPGVIELLQCVIFNFIILLRKSNKEFKTVHEDPDSRKL